MTYSERVSSATTPLPRAFHKNEPGIMTVNEFLTTRNPGGKYHEQGSYETTVDRLNEDYSLRDVGTAGDYDVYQNARGILLKLDGEVEAVIHRGTAYRKKDVRLPNWYHDRNKGYKFDVKQTKVVKYPVEYTKLVSDVARDNLKRYPVVIQNLREGEAAYQLRAERAVRTDKGDTLVLLNSSGLEIGMASDEWGATLIQVAKEYQRRGFGKLLAKYWYRLNPSYGSGGFTRQGRSNAIRAWEERVREFLSRGWYSQLIKNGRISKKKVNNILGGLSGPKPVLKRKELKAKPQPIIMIDFPMFAVYDMAFYDEPDEKYVYGYGFYRDSHPVGSFLYRIDYDRKYGKLTTMTALHTAKQGGVDEIYVGQGYGDLLEYDLTERDGDYVESLSNPQIEKISRLERQVRKRMDPYGEKYALLLETAESKWS